ncbi:uncharacterized protein GGS22DRAFT_185097 [Annulohypoxylon maeteangense]|uniref:uncharacterized protein n=1 Tax=Annulohypoxylon maeteangense TaxID=1927788 RepID=UPI00200723A5|nr:uncharacterized protein GGS22DRAFT_185097 [Annulohypoxylon maeteangense]KAI0887719.1 hypothetical protein GGS22DRAFT_185097 [Annulohypoxylon maeteangense]
MAPNKKGKKIAKKGKSTTRHRPVPAVEGAYGNVLNDGRFECRLSVRRRPCGARMANESHNIRSHISKKHRVDSAYKKNQRTGNWPCTWADCMENGSTYSNFHSLVGHARSFHGMKGSSKALKKKSGNLLQKIRMEYQKKKREEQRQMEDDEDDGEDEPLFIDAPDYSDGNHGDKNQEDRDPPGTGGSQPIPVA